MRAWILVFGLIIGCGGKVAVDTGSEPVHACTDTCRAALEDGGEPCASVPKAVEWYGKLVECACSADTCAEACAAELCSGEPTPLGPQDGGALDPCFECIGSACGPTAYNPCLMFGH
jgi:hypothetical protein